MQKSIEAEYWVVDQDGELTGPGELTEYSENVEEEFVRPLLELKTPPCETFSALRSTFLELLDELLDKADELDKVLVPLGTPINSGPIELRPSERSRIQKRVLGDNFAYAKHCAGTHLHFEKRNVTDQLNVLASLDPALALLNSSPYFRGETVANGARAYIYRKKCYEYFPLHGQLWDYVNTVGQWERQLDRLFDSFKAASMNEGVSETNIDASFSPQDIVWTPVRLRDEMPTVEWRAPDTSLPSQILRLAEDVGTIMEHLHHAEVRIEGDTGEVTADRITIPEFDAVLTYVEEAIHEGVESPALSSYLERMGFDVGEYDPLTRNIDGRDYVSPDEAREIRLRYGDRLRRDVDNLIT
ncbi:glutamate-cysteine ligase family protein [Natrarchaeobaculum aegyptiacum]|uniref:Glutamate--cysteine ligase n=1 Tax=Natrarchaeobaculum aegyptiacum TaxID=745377 RepID=A0A2Z2HWZ9_9EURY|nr:glutamate-cysteine ligase family protein [Natrarchaeobaculum aegyptiacum]ARS90157.1 glutamate--cysteine ligase [Natrarchaeobaculum aegyptiacum]